MTNPKMTTHGYYGTPIYRSWVDMKQRCLNSNCSAYHNYGGRGIKVCKRWVKFENFLADMGECPKGLTLDRKNNNGNYTKRNCKWSTRKEQVHNRRPLPSDFGAKISARQLGCKRAPYNRYEERRTS